MNLTKRIIFVVSFFITQSYANDIQIEGVWCGKWDNIYATCFEIEKSEQNYFANYRWEETIGRGFQKKRLSGKLLNVNTLDLSGKIIIVDLHDHDKAVAMGIFDNHSRIAYMTRIKKTGLPDKE